MQFGKGFLRGRYLIPAGLAAAALGHQILTTDVNEPAIEPFQSAAAFHLANDNTSITLEEGLASANRLIAEMRSEEPAVVGSDISNWDHNDVTAAVHAATVGLRMAMAEMYTLAEADQTRLRAQAEALIPQLEAAGEAARDVKGQLITNWDLRAELGALPSFMSVVGDDAPVNDPTTVSLEHNFFCEVPKGDNRGTVLNRDPNGEHPVTITATYSNAVVPGFENAGGSCDTEFTYGGQTFTAQLPLGLAANRL